MGIVALALIAAAPMRASATDPENRLEAAADITPRTLALGALGGGRREAADHRGRVVLVHFFATWCEPCRPELASLDRLNREMGPRGVEILAVSVAEPEMRLRRFFAEQPVSFAILLDQDRAASRAWAIEALPSTVVLDRWGVPRLAVRGDLDWQRAEVRAALDDLLDETEPRRTGGDRP
ncbi:TlpA disulfide reductase family protein [Enterovirga rhinocerotis]|uniref:Peroxiredoxin n=1 Tax=Enterovirga rhinocerotis TaxID=1339210 RepID=A0A4R7BL07_9HYPH|nr:TlpA disulfide reductase family protein [Enterovirga rhinocerotis]TDR84556.1 peroxiredoxin [Enterovirga rhinocerotis]